MFLRILGVLHRIETLQSVRLVHSSHGAITPASSAKGTGNTLRFAGVYIVNAKEIAPDEIRQRRSIPPVFPPEVFRDPSRLHQYLTKLEHDSKLNRTFFIPTENSNEEPGIGDDPKKQISTAIQVNRSYGTSLTLNLDNFSPQPMSDYLSTTKLWDLDSERWNKFQSQSYRGVNTSANEAAWTHKEDVLLNAVENNDVEGVFRAIADGADVNRRKNRYGASFLHFASFNGHAEATDALISKGANVNIEASNGSRPLHWAAQEGQLNCVIRLVEHGADIHATTNTWFTDSVYGKSSGQTALHWAAEQGHVDCVMFLLERGGISAAEDERGKKPEDLSDSPKVKNTFEKEKNRKFICVEFTFPSRGFAGEFHSLSNLWRKNKDFQEETPT
eukprot:TRINITY_DN4351_c0_g1_i2.p1 TRINITY_DN4351_c0_g1~~TRINITY_DN4351_c0_g1_i2.p1  ORF type:complete len:388 (+),score=69.45 TRINITY_DN4351_c0_g1_i2:1-1164(+)